MVTSVRRRAGTVALGLGLALLFSWPQAVVGEPVAAGPVYLHQVHDVTDPVCRSKTLEPRDGDLIGPHFAFTVSCVRFTDDLADWEGRSVAYRGAPHPARAKAGLEFGIVQLAPRAPTAAAGARAEASLELGDRQVPLSSFPRAGDVLVFTVPTGEPANLAVTTNGYTQRFDLRGKTRQDEITGYYLGTEGTIATSGYTVSVTGVGPHWSGTLHNHGGLTIRRAMWDPDLGWAEPGKAHVEVVLTWPRPGVTAPVDWRLRPGTSINLVGGHQRFSPQSVSSSTEPADIYYIYRYTVPDDVVEFTLTFQPSGELISTADGAAIKTLAEPHDIVYPIDFGLEGHQGTVLS